MYSCEEKAQRQASLVKRTLRIPLLMMMALLNVTYWNQADA